MQLRRTITIHPNRTSVFIKVKIFVSDVFKTAAFWNVDDNSVLLSEDLYREFNGCKTQEEQRKFFDKLHKISFTDLPV